MDKVAYQGQMLTRWRVGRSTFLALPERGARLMSWNLAQADGSVRDILYWPEQADFADIAKVRGGNPILFPFNGRCFDQGEIFFWRADDGVKRAIPLHGIARQGEFVVTEIDDHGFAARFVPGEEAKAAYPFDYEFVVKYRFTELGLSCDFTLHNRDQRPLPWSAGHHFYFTVPWNNGRKRSDYAIRIPATQRLKQDKAGGLVAGPDLQAEESLGNPALVDTFHTGLTGNEVSFGDRAGSGTLRVSLGHDPKPALGATFVTWTLADDSPFYCVEPWMGPANAAEHKVGLQVVPPGGTGTFSVAVAVS
jgi:galactose mutarotase-like enzyme